MLDFVNHHHSPGLGYSYDPVKDTLSLLADRTYEAVSAEVKSKSLFQSKSLFLISDQY